MRLTTDVFGEHMKLLLKSCCVRSWKLDDADSCAQHANNRKIWLNLRDAFPHPYTIDDARSYLAYLAKTSPETDFAIDVGGNAVGGIGAKRQTDVHRFTAEIGYWLGEEFWGRGLMTEVIPAFADYLFQTFSLQRVYAVPYANNLASSRVLEKAGFVYEGRMKRSAVKDGVVLDQLVYAKTKD